MLAHKAVPPVTCCLTPLLLFCSLLLQARFERFGPVTACRVVMDKATGKPKGTAFIEFKGAAGAAAAADACARARAGKGPDVTVKGVKLSVDLALTQDDARRLGQEQGGVPGAGKSAGQSNKGGKFDRRNLYLAKEGFIEEGSAQWEAMSENDRWGGNTFITCYVDL